MISLLGKYVNLVTLCQLLNQGDRVAFGATPGWREHAVQHGYAQTTWHFAHASRRRSS